MATYPITLLLVGVRFRPQLLDTEEEANAIADFVDSHLFQHLLVHFEKVFAIDVVLPEELLVLATFDTSEIVTDLVFVPGLDRIGAVRVGKIRVGRTRKGVG